MAATVAAPSFSGGAAFAARTIPIIDTHVHLVDPRRPQGAPWSGPAGMPPQVSLPETYRPMAREAGITGAIVVEASGWIEDNLWILERAASDPLFVGVVGNLDPGKPDFATTLDRFSKNPLWRGIRHSRVWEIAEGRHRLRPGILDGLNLLASRGQTLDMANPSFDLLRGALLVMEAVPGLRVVMDHMPSLDPTPQTQALYDSLLRDLSAHPNFFIKLSQVRHRDTEGQVVTAPRERLDQLMAAMGEDRVMFGSDWPNAAGVVTVPQAVAMMQDYFRTRPRAQAEKYFWRNAQAIYRWQPR